MKATVTMIAVTAMAAVVGGTAAGLLIACGGELCPTVNAPPRPSVAKAAFIDLAPTYGRVKMTIFNKKTRVVFASPHEFFSDSGCRSFDLLKFDDLSRLPDDLRLVSGRRLTRGEIAAIEDMP